MVALTTASHEAPSTGPLLSAGEVTPQRTPFSRRQFLRGLALGGAVIAGELWIPGAKLISIPKRPPAAKFDHQIHATGFIVKTGPDQCELIGQRYAAALIRSLEQTRWEITQQVLAREFGG